MSLYNIIFPDVCNYRQFKLIQLFCLYYALLQLRVYYETKQFIFSTRNRAYTIHLTKYSLKYYLFASVDKEVDLKKLYLNYVNSWGTERYTPCGMGKCITTEVIRRKLVHIRTAKIYKLLVQQDYNIIESIVEMTKPIILDIRDKKQCCSTLK